MATSIAGGSKKSKALGTPSSKRGTNVKPRKPVTAPRKKPRVQSDQDDQALKKSAKHRESAHTDPVVATAQNLGSGEILIMAQLSELVPVAKYASVTVGPYLLGWKTNADMSILADVDWDDDSTPLTKEQQAVFDHVYGALQASSRIINDLIREDREIVEGSLRQHSDSKDDK